jgi:hypothetical protein
MANNPKAFRIVLGILAYGGMAVLGLGTLLLLRSLSLAARGQRAEGTVIAHVGSRDSDDRTTVRAVVRFRADGREVEFTNPVGTDPPLHKVNDRVTVLYWPPEPEGAVIDGFAELYLQPIIVAGMGLCLLAIGGGFLWGPAWFASRRQRIILEGLPVPAKVVAIRQDKSVTVDDQSPWVIVAVFKDEWTGQTIQCTSHYLWANPAPDYPVGSEVTVYYLQGRPHKHAFQLDKIQEADE